MVLDYDDRRAVVYEPVKHIQQALHVAEMQAYGRLFQ